MVAVVSGSGLGLFNSSTSTLGGGGANGNALVGRGRDRVYVNTTTGNLLVQSADDILAAVGLDFAALRTYNSQGFTDEDNNDQWRLGVHQRLSAVTGGTGVNTAGSKLTKTFGDGTEVVYTYNTTRTRYEANDGDGANDFIKVTSGVYTWTDGSTRATEEYAVINSVQRIKFSRDADGNTVTYNYTGALLTSINMANPGAVANNAQTITFSYTGTNLTAVGVASYNGSAIATQTLTRYFYDTSHRLKQVVLDLTPANNTVPLPDANADGYYETTANETYITTYTYDGTSKRIASIAQSDGSSVSFTYQSLDTGFRLKTVTDAEGRVMTFTYTNVLAGTATLPTIYRNTTVQDGLGFITTYVTDSTGRVTSVTTPSVGGSSIETRYTYDATTGNVATITQDPTGLNRVTTIGYDANTGLLLSSRDSLGNTVTRTYNAHNQIETETSYLVRDPDGAGSGAPTTPLTTRYIYDGDSITSEGHLLFVISPDGRVTEHVYNTAGDRITTYEYAAVTYPSAIYTKAALDTWAAGQRGSALERVDYAYDFRGNISTISMWAATSSIGAGTGAASVTRFVYDQRGMLLSTVEARGEETTSPANDYLTNYTYDGLGRVLTKSTWVSAPETARQIQAIAYDDANRKTVTTLANGLVNTATYNRSGDLISVANGISTATTSLGTTSFTYDADGRLRVTTDATLLKTYCFYDDAGRKIGTVDGDGSLTEYIYNRAHQLIKTVRHSTRLGATTLGNLSGGTWSTVAFPALRSEANATPATNQIVRNVYDASGMLVFTLEDIGAGVSAVAKNVYDGAGRLTDTIRYFNTQTFAASVDEVLPAGITAATNGGDRRTRFFYNNDGQLAGTLDAAGFLKENIYDAAGRLITQIGYFNASDPARWTAGTLETLRPGSSGSVAQLDANRDIRARFFYDAQGRKTGELDGGRYLTEIVYDVAGNVMQTIRYDDVNGNLSQTARSSDIRADTSGTTTIAALKTAAIAANAATHSTSYTYDGLGQVLTETNFENTQTLYSYDIAGNLIATTRADGVSAEARTARTRYDVMGRVTQELTAEGAAALAALPGGASQTDIDNVWSKYGVLYTYDTASRRTSATVRPNDSQTATTYYYYDEDGRLRFELDALGRVRESRYNALGQLTESIVHWKTVSVSSPAGGLLTPALITTLTSAESANVHERTTYAYSQRGQLLSTTTVGGATTGTTYNVFGEVDTATVGGQAAISYTYDARGLRKLTKRSSITLEDRTFDAFGRLTTVVDRGNTKTVTHDRLGREVTSLESGDASSRQISYDAFSRVKTVIDKLGNQTTYQYVDSTRTVTVTTQEGIVVSTVHNLNGDTLSVTANGNTTNYVYDLNGALTGVSDNLGSLEGRAYDRAGRQVSATDARGTVTTFGYDVASRMLTRTVDTGSGGLALVTTYSYDANTRAMTVTEPGSRVTRTEYDRDGRVSAIVADATGAKPFRTEYQYDAANNSTLITEGVGAAAGTPIRRTQYQYDSAGRRTHEYVDPTSLGGMLNIHTEYRYDSNDNLTRKIDASGNSTWYVYDAQHRLSQTIDALGGVTQLSYDSEDRVVATRRYANTVTTSGLGDTPAALTAPTLAQTTRDRVSRSVFDRDGREKYTLQTLSATGSPGSFVEKTVVTERTFDAAGNVTRTRVYLNEVTLPAALTTTSVAGAITVHADDRIERMVYDVRGRLEIRLDGSGAVTKYEYDVSGNITKTTQYAATAPLDNAMRVWYVGGTNSSSYRSLGNFNTGDVVTATVRFKTSSDTTGAMFLGDTGGPNPYDNADYTGIVYGNDGWQTLTLRVTLSHPEEMWVYLYGDRDGPGANSSHSVFYDNLTISSVQRGTVVSEPFADNSAWNISGTMESVNVPLTDFGSDAQIRALVNGLATAGEDRVTRFWYDGLDRARFTLDAEGFLSETRYADGTRVEESYRYFNAPTVAANATTAQVAAAIMANPLDRYERSEFDTAGRLALCVDVFNKTEIYEYDAVGNKIKFTNKKGSVWNYVYDANHRLIEERSPAVGVVTVSESSPDGGTLTAAGTTVEIVSKIEYNALGDVTRRVEAFGRAEQRETLYGYDLLGRQNAISTPNVLVYAPSGNELTGVRQESSVTLVSSTTYDVFGNAVLGQDAYGNYSHKAYDHFGRLVYDVDVLRNVTSYQYDSFGNVTKLTRHLNQVSLTAPTALPDGAAWTSAEVASHLTTNTRDRAIVTEYDRLNRATRVLQPAGFNFDPMPGAGPGGTPSSVGAETKNVYNAFGEVVLQRQLFRSPATWADTYLYYDRLGRRTASVDALGYLTRDTYDAVGNVTRHFEAAKPLTGTWNEFSYRGLVESNPTLALDAAAGYDRDFRYLYDRLDRKKEARQLHVEVTSVTGQSASRSFVEQVTTFDFEAVGNQVRVIDHAGAATYKYYDVLGRVMAVAEPTRDIDGTGDPAAVTGLTPLTLFLYNAHGDLVGEVQYANGAASVGIDTYTPAAANAKDRNTRILVDAFGRIRRTQDGLNSNQFASYDKLGKAAKEWQPVVNVNGVTETLVTLHRYDKLGREIAIVEPQKVGTGALTIYTQTRYNAFGEISEKGTSAILVPDGTSLQEYYEYDDAGRLWKTNAKGGVDTIILYDLMGNATAEIRSLSVNLRTDAGTQTAVGAYGLSLAQAMRTETVYDKRGGVVEQRQPTFEAGSGVDPIAATFTIGMVDGPSNPAAVYQRQFVDYGGEGNGLEEIYVFNPAATLAQDGGWYLNASGEYQQDAAHFIVSALRITWVAPTDSGVIATFQYRPAGSTNENDWAGAPVGSLAGDKLGVTVSSLTNQNYEYRVRYQRAAQVTYFAEAKGAFRVDGTTSATLGIVPTGADPASEIATLPSVSTGGMVSWAAPSGSLAGITATFRIQAGGLWTNKLATLSGTTFTADLHTELATAETYAYEVVYQRVGITIALKAGVLVSTGLTNVRQVVVNSHSPLTVPPNFSELIGTATAQTAGLIGATILSSQVWTVSGTTHSFQGTNQIQLNWADIGPGAVKVYLDYLAQPFEVKPGQEWQSRPGREVVNRELIPAGGARTGAVLSFGTAPVPPHENNSGGIAIVRKVVVMRETTPGSGVYTAVYVQTNPTASYGRSLTWPAPLTWSTGMVPSFEYAPQGTSNYTPLAIITGSQWGVSLNDVLTGNYVYRIRFRVGNRVRAEQTGSFSIVAGGAVSSSVSTNATFPPTLFTASLSGDTLSWTQPTDGSPTTVVLTWSYFGAQAGSGSVNLASTSGTYSYRFAELINSGPVQVGYSIKYLRSGETDAYAVGGGNFNLTIDNTQVQPQITIQSQNPGYPSGVQAIPAPTSVSNRYVTWSPQAAAGAAVEFRYRQPNTGTWTTLPAPFVSGAYQVDTLGVANATYEYEITYTSSGQTNPYARGRGQFTVNRISTVTNFTITPTPFGGPTLVQRTPRQLQTLDRWGNVLASTDTAGNTTNYRYTALGGVAQLTMPQVEVVSTAGGNLMTTPSAVPKSYNYYDALGRLVGTKDANGNVNSVAFNAAGQTLRETHADGGFKSFVYDAFGNAVIVVDELGWGTVHHYNQANRLVMTQREVSAGVWIDKQFFYDEAGRRVRETNGATSAVPDGDGGVESTRYTYDLAGNLITRRTELGYTTTYGYDVQGRKTSEVDAIGGSMSWTYDDFFLRTHTNLAGLTYAYDYNKAGLQTTQTGGGTNITNSYDWSGHLTSINDTAVGRLTTYSYDAAGRRTREKAAINGAMHQDTVIGYDTLGRITTLTDLRYDLKYSYDAQGNRTHISATYYDHQQLPKTQDLWYTYDAMNRVLVSQGVNIFNAITIDNTGGVRMTYDLVGQRKTATQWGDQFIRHEIREVYRPAEGGMVTFEKYVLQTRTYSDTYTYDGAGRLIYIDRSGETYEFASPPPPQSIHETTTAGVFRVSERTYDGASRITSEIERAVERAEDRSQLLVRTHTSVYDDDSRLASQTNSREFGTFTIVTKTETTISYSVDGAGVVRSYAVAVWDTADGHANTVNYTSTYVNSFRGVDSYLDAGQSVSSVGSGKPKDGATTRGYNVNNELTSFVDTRDHRKNRYFANDASGRALTVIQPITTETGATPDLSTSFQNALLRRDNSTRSQHFFFANGQAIGSFGQLIDESGQFKANFDVNYQPISRGSLAAAPPTVIAQTGDTARTIAARVFGDPGLWYLIAEENGFTGPETVIPEGTSVRIPNEVISLKNDASTFKPFNPADAIGDTTPTQPFPPPPQKGCGIIGMIIMIVVLVVVTIFTAGTMTAAAGSGFTAIMSAGAGALVGAGAGLTFIGGALAAAAGSAASQLVGMAIGAQDKFDWKGVATAAIGGGVTAGLGGGLVPGADSANVATRVLANGANAAISNVLTQGVSMAAGLQKSFDWRSVAQSAVAAPIAAEASRFVGNKVGVPSTDPGEYNFAKFASDTTGTLTTAAVRSAMGGRFDVKQVAADIFGNAIANALVASTIDTPAERRARDKDSYSFQRLREARGFAGEPAFDDSLLRSALTKNPPAIDLSAISALPQLSEPPADSTYVVGKGDSYAGIARKRYGDERYASVIMAANNIQPTYGEVHGLQIGRSLTLPDLDGASQEMVDVIHQTGGPLIAADRAVTNEIAQAKEYARMVDLATNHPDSFGGTVALAKLTGRSFDDIVADRYIANLPPPEMLDPQTQWDIMSATTGVPNLPRIARAFNETTDAFLNHPATVRTLATVGLVGNVVEAAASGTAAVLTAETGIGAVGFGAVFLLSVDSAQANARQLWTGEYRTPESVQLLESAGLPPIAANLAVGGVTGGGGYFSTLSIEAKLASGTGLMSGRTWQSPIYFDKLSSQMNGGFIPPLPVGFRSPLAQAGLPDGSFSIIDWTGYPSHIPRPTGPFRMIEGAEYDSARSAANSANAALHRADSAFDDLQLHEIHPVKFGGSPASLANKVALTHAQHVPANRWWGDLQRYLEGIK